MVILVDDSDHEARQHSAPDTQPFFDAVRRRAGLKPEIGHASYEPESKLATDEDYPATEMNADYSDAIEGV
jgi:hypothetical protein